MKSTASLRLSKVVQKFNGTFVVLAPNSVKRDAYNFQEHKADIISALNDYAAAITDLGLATGLHQHTGTCIESRDEVYTVMEAVNTKNLKFAPDVGQLQKGGADAAKVVKDFLPLVKHMHLKDYKGWQYYSGYCPLGMGTVDLPAILDMMDKRRSDQRCHGRVGSLPGRSYDALADGSDHQGLFAETRIYVSQLTPNR